VSDIDTGVADSLKVLDPDGRLEKRSGLSQCSLQLVGGATRNAPAPANPRGQGATTLEWTLPSSPPFHQFDTLPRVVGPSFDSSSEASNFD
jgi:heme/copper-type cytochrome/quinol oxidase subunit 1